MASQLAQLQTEIRNYKRQLEQQKDYQEIKQERDQLKIELNQKEHQIIIKIISELKLGLNNETNLEQVLDKIKELIADKTPDANQEDKLNSLHQQIATQEKEINQLKEQNKENLPAPETIKQQAEKVLKDLGLENSTYQPELAQITSLSQLTDFYQKVSKNEIDKVREGNNRVRNWNVALLLLFIGSLLITAFLIAKTKSKKLLTPNNKKGRGK